MISEMVRVPARYLLSSPTVALIGERVGDLQGAAANAGVPCPLLVEIHGEAPEARFRSVGRSIADAAEEYRDRPHVVVLITHEGLTGTPMDGFTGWHACVDETPTAVSSGVMTIPATSRFFEAAYALEPVDGLDWCRVVPKPDAPSVADVRVDENLSAQHTLFHRRSKSPQGVYVDVADWRDARDRRRRVQWWSAWTPAELAPFETATIAASSFFHSLTYKASVACGDGTAFEAEAVPGPDTRDAKVLIRHFSSSHRGSTEFWKEGAGKRNLNAVCRYLEREPIGFWSGNACVAAYFEHRLPGQPVRPKAVVGSNNLDAHETCAFIYSSKAQPGDAVLLSAFGLSRDDVQRARETEDVWQFALRGAIRRRDFAGTYTVFVYDRWQAAALAEMMRDAGVAGEVVVEHVAAPGFEEIVRGTPGPAPRVDPRPHAEREAERKRADRERKARARALEREARAAAGTLRSRGRPRRPEGMEERV
jgi:hypothetical protein